ncbi:MAG: RNA-binding transcriptional accessory protein, partial [Collinsella aerofaciens]|nr:RNA-binding transcriptional accessory protein [Collinsella aerofaciens]
MDLIAQLARELNLKAANIEAAVKLIDEGNTIPFISRYRKEATGGMDDVALRALDERLSYLRNLEQRKEDVILLIDAQGKLTPELEQQIREATQLQRVEDLYKPYRKKRMTRAQKAREAGLEPLANMIIMQASAKGSALDAAATYVNEEAGFDTPEKALAGAADIVASTTMSAVKTPYEPYYNFDEPLRRIPNHRVLAIDRGEREGKLRVCVNVDGAAATARLGSRWPRRQGVFAPIFDAAIADGYKRLMAPSLEREVRAKLTVRAQTEAINVFAKNLEGLLSARPVRGARVLALDPGYRTGCKVAVMDETGKLLDHSVVYPTKPRHDIAGTKRELARLVKKDGVNTIVIGNGTASRETEEVVSEFIAEQAPGLRYTIVNEAGASVYSASELASQEYPDLDVTVRGAMSLGRRLQDPLAELVKIPPQSIGVGQYQHDLDQAELSRTLGHVVEDVVNRVGVDVNTASASLLGYVSGITPSVAKNIVAYREENGAFTDRRQLKKVPKLGPKAYLNAAGFLRISGGKSPLDATSVHPESYEVATSVLERAGVKASELSRGGVPDIERRLGSISALASDLDCGTLTLIDIVNELKKPGRDPRDDAPEVVFSRSALSIDDLEPGMELKGTVRNV